METTTRARAWSSRKHAPQYSMAREDRVLRRGEEMQRDQGDENVGRGDVQAVEEGIDAAVIDAPGRQQYDVEEIDAELAEVRGGIARHRHGDHAGVEQH